jgi:outer membrane lipoprotein-sorting protein
MPRARPPTMKGMIFRRGPLSILLICLISWGLSSCLARRRLITRKATGGKAAANLLVADQASLIATIAKHYNAVDDFSATVDMTPALGTAEKSQITEYKDVTGYILFRKPAQIHIIGLYPVIRSKAFDMASTGADFKLYLPSRNLFLSGSNQIGKPSANKIENLRPQYFLDAMLVRPVDAAENKILMTNMTDEDGAYYILHEIRQAANGNLQMHRTLWFNRLDLLLARQLIFDASGNILTDSRYSEWKPWDNVPFPKHIDFNRPQDGIGVVLDIRKMDINKGVPDDKFVLTQPEGTKLQIVGQAQGPAK